MKKYLLVISLLTFVTTIKAQIILNPSFDTSLPIGFMVVPEEWDSEGVAFGLTDAVDDEYEFVNPILSLFPDAVSTDKFWYFFSNTADQYGGFSQTLNKLQANTEYCLSFEAGVNRPWQPSTSIDLQMYLDDMLVDSETFKFPSENTSRIVNLCFTSDENIGPSNVLTLRTNKLVGNTSFVLIKAGSGSFTSDMISSNHSLSYNVKKVEVFPNPSNGSIHIISKETFSNSHVKIYSSIGQKVFEETISTNDGYILDLSSLDAGIYFLKFFGDNELITTNKIILKN